MADSIKAHVEVQPNLGESMYFEYIQSGVLINAVSIEEAIAARRAHHEAMARGVRLEPIARSEFSSEFLLSENLIGGVADAMSS